MSYEGESAYITGGAGGIGKVLAARLVSQGAKVIVADRNIKGAEEVCQKLNQEGHAQVAWPVEIDASDWESQRNGFETGIARLGRINYVFPVAGIMERPWLADHREGQGFVKPDLAVMDVNGNGAMYTVALAIQHFRGQEPDRHGFRGKVAVVASASGFYPIDSVPIYTAAKHALVGFVRCVGKSLPTEKITLNAICPNIVRTGISAPEWYDMLDAKGLLIDPESMWSVFESLMGDNDTSGEAIEVLPGNDGHRIKEWPEFTNDKCRESVEIVIERAVKARKAALESKGGSSIQ